ncbi:hypothetical protein Leryth_003467 [Lithospermum erythrorhizon]|nr:hypothetical protein Leryth_003467 [Lithospermum erythrorhizon]
MSAVVNNLEKEDEQITAASPQSCLSDSATRSCLRSASLPSTLKLVSAIKGSREKLGNPPRKLSVTWDPDVYDPVPTAASHVPTNKSPRHRGNGKKNGRNKQKEGGKSSHGSSRSKDKKKQARKANAGSSRCYKALVDDFPEGPLESLASMADFEVGSADALCGSSFLKKSVARLHFPVAEAT